VVHADFFDGAFGRAGVAWRSCPKSNECADAKRAWPAGAAAMERLLQDARAKAQKLAARLN
jgi:hypothetical protein